MMRKTESLSKLVVALAKGQETPTSLAEKSLERATQLADLNAFVAIDEKIVMAQAKAATLRRQSGAQLSALDGIPLAVKDNYLTMDYPTTACSKAAPLEPGGQDATVVANLRAAGAVVFGKTNMHEWAYGATNTASSFGVTRNPHNRDHITGGSSGGSGAAVASGIVPAALGSDTGGSVRIPSSACGIYGFKPSYGRASRHGVLPLSWSLDAPGPMAAALEDIVQLLPYILGPDEHDKSAAHASPLEQIPPIDDVRLLNLTGPGLERATEVDAALGAALECSGASVQQGQLAGVGEYFAAWEAILHCEASTYHSTLLAMRPDGFSDVTRAHLVAGQEIKATELLFAQQIRAKLMRHLQSLWSDYDALVLPTLPVPAPAHGENWQEFGGRRVTTQDAMTWFCWLGNLAGLPCLSMPIGTSGTGLPIGMMLMGKPGGDEDLLGVARKLDRQINNVG